MRPPPPHTHPKPALFLSFDLPWFSPISALNPYLQVGNGGPSLSYDMTNRSDIPNSLCRERGCLTGVAGFNHMALGH